MDFKIKTFDSQKISEHFLTLVQPLCALIESCIYYQRVNPYYIDNQGRKTGRDLQAPTVMLFYGPPINPAKIGHCQMSTQHSDCILGRASTDAP